MAFHHSPRIVSDGLILTYDAANVKSYPGSGTTWNDISGDNTGTLNNGPTFSTDGLASFDFDGTNDDVSFTTPSAFNGATLNSFNCTLSSWAKFETIAQFEAIICLGTYDLEIAPVTATAVGIWVDNASLGGVTYTPTLDVWNNYSMTKSGNTYSLYVDGQLIGAASDNDNATIGSTSYLARNGATSYFNGKIGIANIYNRALTAAEVLQNYNALKGRFE